MHLRFTISAPILSEQWLFLLKNFLNREVIADKHNILSSKDEIVITSFLNWDNVCTPMILLPLQPILGEKYSLAILPSSPLSFGSSSGWLASKNLALSFWLNVTIFISFLSTSDFRFTY